jgi:hypothetical protein
MHALALTPQDPATGIQVSSHLPNAPIAPSGPTAPTAPTLSNTPRVLQHYRQRKSSITVTLAAFPPDRPPLKHLADLHSPPHAVLARARPGSRRASRCGGAAACAARRRRCAGICECLGAVALGDAREGSGRRVGNREVSERRSVGVGGGVRAGLESCALRGDGQKRRGGEEEREGWRRGEEETRRREIEETRRGEEERRGGEEERRG